MVYGAIQIAPDGKIYGFRYGASALDVIQFPSLQGAAAGFAANAQSLGQASAQLGLPNIITNFVSQTPPSISNLSVLNFSETSAILSAFIDSDGGSEIIERGFYFGTDTLSIENETLVSGTTGQMVLEIENLLPETIYYFGAYASNAHGTTHINWESFESLPEIDTIPPVALCNEHIVLELDEYGYAYLTVEMVDNGSFDNNGIAEISIDKTEFYCDDLGENQVTLTVIDYAGNSSSCTTTVYIQDNTAPKIQVEYSTEYFYIIGENAFTLPDFYSEGKVWTYDNCTQNVTHLGQEPAPGTLLDVGVHTLLLSAVDDSGNSASIAIEIVIESALTQPNFSDDFEITLFPNPTTDYFQIKSNSRVDLQAVDIFDVSGKLIQSIPLNNSQHLHTVDVSYLASSFYFVVLKADNTTTIKRLVKR